MNRKKPGELVWPFQTGKCVGDKPFHRIGEHNFIAISFEQRNEMTRIPKTPQPNARNGKAPRVVRPPSFALNR
jgi:hypothetical protein